MNIVQLFILQLIGLLLVLEKSSCNAQLWYPVDGEDGWYYLPYLNLYKRKYNDQDFKDFNTNGLNEWQNYSEGDKVSYSFKARTSKPNHDLPDIDPRIRNKKIKRSLINTIDAKQSLNERKSRFYFFPNSFQPMPLMTQDFELNDQSETENDWEGPNLGSGMWPGPDQNLFWKRKPSRKPSKKPTTTRQPMTTTRRPYTQATNAPWMSTSWWSNNPTTERPWTSTDVWRPNTRTTEWPWTSTDIWRPNASTTARPWASTTQRTKTTTPGTDSSVSGTTTMSDCERRCQTTNEYNPVCGTDFSDYTNPGRLKCAQKCGKRVELLHHGVCTSTSRAAVITTTFRSRPNDGWFS